MTVYIHHNGETIPYTKLQRSFICQRCGETNTPGKPDSCLGHLPGVSAACCGHGGEGYIKFTNGVIIRGKFLIEKSDPIIKR